MGLARPIWQAGESSMRAARIGRPTVRTSASRAVRANVGPLARVRNCGLIRHRVGPGAQEIGPDRIDRALVGSGCRGWSIRHKAQPTTFTVQRFGHLPSVLGIRIGSASSLRPYPDSSAERAIDFERQSSLGMEPARIATDRNRVCVVG